MNVRGPLVVLFAIPLLHPLHVATAIECRYNQYLCEDEIGCVNRSDICNGVKDCRDGSDEDDCNQAVKVFGLYFGLLILLIIVGGALMYLVSRCCCANATHPKANEEKLNEKSFLLKTPRTIV